MSILKPTLIAILLLSAVLPAAANAGIFGHRRCGNARPSCPTSPTPRMKSSLELQAEINLLQDAVTNHEIRVQQLEQLLRAARAPTN